MENTDKENADTAQEIKEDVKRIEIMKKNSSELPWILENKSDLIETKENVLNLPVRKENSLESALLIEIGYKSAVVMDEFVGIEKKTRVKESASDLAPIKENMPELTSTLENILQLNMVEENVSKVLAIKEGGVKDSLLLKVDLGSEIVSMHQDSESQDAFNQSLSQYVQQHGPSELNQDICWTHSQESNTQSDGSTLRKLLTTNDWSTLRHRYDISDFGHQYGNILSKNYRTKDKIFNEKSNTNKKSTEIKYVVKKKRNKNEKVLTAYKEKYITDAKKSQINVERKKTIAFFNHYNFHTNKHNSVEGNKLDNNISDINCNFSTYKEKSVNNKLYTDVTQSFDRNDESSAYISDIYNLHINKQNSIKTNKLRSVLDPFCNFETNKQNGFENNKLNFRASAEASDVNYNFHTNKQNCKAKTKIHTAVSTDTVFHNVQNTGVEKPSRNTASDKYKMIDIESQLQSNKDRNVYKCISCDYAAKGSGLNRHINHTTSDFGTNMCKQKSIKGGRSYNHTRPHSVHKIHTREDCDSKEKKKSIHTNGKSFKYMCVHKHKRNRELSKTRNHIDVGPCSCESCGYQNTQFGAVKDHLIHTREKSFSCDLCEYKCGTKLHLVNYIKTLSDENSTLECTNSSVKS